MKKFLFALCCILSVVSTLGVILAFSVGNLYVAVPLVTIMLLSYSVAVINHSSSMWLMLGGSVWAIGTSALMFIGTLQSTQTDQSDRLIISLVCNIVLMLLFIMIRQQVRENIALTKT